MFQKPALFAVFAAISLTTAAAAMELDPKLRDYQPVSGVSGSIKSIGSDTLNNLMTLWAEGFKAQYPNVKIEIEGKGSSTAPPALIAGTAQFGPMSRPMKAAEIDEFEKKFGYKPTAIRTAVDALAVFVHKDNPIKCLTLQQVDAIFSKTRKGGVDKDIATWGDLGLTGEWADKPISPLRPQLRLRHLRLLQGGRALQGRLQGQREGAARLLGGRAGRRPDKYAIGYSGIGYKTADVRAVPLAQEGGRLLRGDGRERLRGQISARALPLHLPEQGPEPAARSAPRASS